MIWANLLHLSFNMWGDRDDPENGDRPIVALPHLRFDESLWNDLLARMAGDGFNMVVLDLGDAVQYQSHPEISLRDAWSPDKLRAELQKMRTLGLEPIPKLNFSTAHDIWLGEYSRMVSTPAYYRVVGDLIREVCDLFDTPRLFHLGMDEETASHQRRFAYAVMRQHELWWHDLFHMVGAVEDSGVRAWVWSDHAWHHPGEFYRQMPKSVLQSNWFYDSAFEGFPEGHKNVARVQTYRDLEAHGYDQVPTGSNYENDVNMEATVAFCTANIAPERLKGFLVTPWHPTLESSRAHHLRAIEQLSRPIAAARAAGADASDALRRPTAP